MLVAKCSATDSNYDKTVCAGPPLKTVQARNDAMEKGYPINPGYDCIDKAALEEMNRREATALAEHQKAEAAQDGRALPQPAAGSVRCLRSAPLAISIAMGLRSFR